MATGIPVILKVANFCEALPACAAIFRRGRLSAPARAVVVWSVVLVLGDALWLIVARARGQNLWLQYVTVPLGSGVALWALAGWQTQEVVRLAYRSIIPVLVVTTAVVPLLLPPVQAFDQLLAPLYSLVLLVAALYTLVYQSLTTSEPVADTNWFWIALGMSLTFGAQVAIRPFAAAFIATRPDWVADAYIARAWTDIVAFLFVTRGILRSPLQLRFGGRS